VKIRMSKFYPLRLITTIGLAVIAPTAFALGEIDITNQIKKGMGGEDVLLSTPLTRPDGKVVKISIAKVLFQTSLGFVIVISGYIFFIYLLPLSRKPEE
jgi:hypothetical protein